VKLEIFNSSPPLPQALFSVDVGLISKSGLKRFNIRSLRKHSRTQNTLNCIFQPKDKISLWRGSDDDIEEHMRGFRGCVCL